MNELLDALRPRRLERSLGSRDLTVGNARARVLRSNKSRLNENAAKNTAKSACEKKGGHNCDFNNAIALPESSKPVVAAIECRRGSKKSYFLSASTGSAARLKAFEKARKAGFRPRDCREIELKTEE